MSDTPPFDFGKFVPGFDFLQNLVGSAGKNASNTVPQMPNMGSWVAPTMNVEDLDKRIEELKTVQFWLDQNAMALKATIQALEVQKMTLATLKGMNLSMADMASAFKFTSPASATPAAAAPKAAEPVTPKPAAAQPTAEAESAKPATGVVDPMAWWGSLTQQFQSIAASALKDAAKQAAFDPANNPAVTMAKDALDPAKNPAVKLAKEAVSAATDMAKAATKSVAVAAAKTSAAASFAKKPAPAEVKKTVPAAAKKVAKTAAKTAVKKAG